jgi:hypothetical protein
MREGVFGFQRWFKPSRCFALITLSKDNVEHAMSWQVCLRLVKRQPGSKWGALGRVQKETKRPLVTISDYTWADGKKSCRVSRVSLCACTPEALPSGAG